MTGTQFDEKLLNVHLLFGVLLKEVNKGPKNMTVSTQLERKHH